MALRPVGGRGQREDNFGLRNKEPARRVGVRRTIANLRISLMIADPGLMDED